MRPSFVSLAASLGLVGCLISPSMGSAARALSSYQASSQAAPTQPAPELETPDRNSTNSAISAVEAPAYDLNLARQKIPPVLLAAITDPYELPHPRTCAEITKQVRVLQAALGPDLDEPETPQAPSLTLHNGKVALALLHGAAESLLPFAGFVRTLSGAGHHDELVVEAITAGSVRRGYLKGMGEMMRCSAPARPIHFVRPPPPAQDDRLRPKYPIN